MGNIVTNPPTLQPAIMDGNVVNRKATFTEIWRRWFVDVAQAINAEANEGLTTTVALAKLTSGGTDGSATFENGKLTKYTAPT